MTSEPLKIALIAHIRFPIAPPFLGGMEAHSWHLANRLVARGHDVTLFASGDSRGEANVVPIIEAHYDRKLPWAIHRGTPPLLNLLQNAYRKAWTQVRQGAFDVVHNNSLSTSPLLAARLEGQPMVTSLHIPPFKLLQSAVEGSLVPWMKFTACSTHHRDCWWPNAAPENAFVVPNGIDISAWPFVATGNGSAVWSGRITPNKGPHLAIDAARALGLDLVLFGTIEDRNYFEAEVAPRLGNGIRFGGHLQQDDLASEVGQASLCFFTPLWDEPFGLVAAEAMMCGVPVAALPNGAVSEVIEPCGAIAAEPTAESLALAGARALRIPRVAVREYASSVFSLDRMVSRYERLYRESIGHAPRVSRASHKVMDTAAVGVAAE